MTLAVAERALGRTDRRVRRGWLRIGPAAPRHRLAFAAEEALRLCALPGESEGRVYYFRRLFIAGVPEDGDRRRWLEAFQHGLTELARAAAHGVDLGAESANAVFFRNEAEACEALLARIARRQSPDAWFWSVVSGVPSGAGQPQHVVGVIEKLLLGPATWAAVAAAVHAAIDPGDPVALLGEVSELHARHWLGMIGGDTPAPDTRAPVRFAHPMPAAIARAVAALGREDPRVLWLASLGVVRARPSDLARGVVVSRARSSLRALDPRASPRHPRPDPARELLAEPAHAAAVDGEENVVDATAIVSAQRDAGFRSAAVGQGPERSAGDDATPDDGADAVARGPQAPRERAAAPHRDPLRGDATAGDAMQRKPAPALHVANATPRASLAPDPEARPEHCFGAATAGAGLYFLLNALRRLKTADDRLDRWFLAHLFRRMARDARIADDDPILLWTRVTLAEDDPVEIDARQLRLWALRIRRWCWRNGRIAARDVICRPGRVTLTATDLDVSLALDAVDVRIRRIGLDLDPGWVPWFGRVVRFHYLSAGELHA